jgi:methyl-accepting chemotaxis protein
MHPRRWKLAQKLGAGFGVVIVIFAAALALTVHLAGTADRRWQAADRGADATDGAARQIEGIRGQMAAQSAYAATGDRRFRREFEQAVAVATEGSEVVAAHGDAVVTEISASAEVADGKHDKAVTTELFPAVERGDRAATLAALAKADRLVRTPLTAAGRIAAHNAAVRDDAAAAAGRATATARRVAAAAGLLGLLVSAGIALLVIRSIRRSVAAITDRLGTLADGESRDLADGLAKVARGDLTRAVGSATAPIEHPGGDELGDVARSVNLVRDRTIASITAYNETRGELAGLIGSVSSTATQLTSASQQMASTSDEAGRAVGEIAHAVSDVAQGAERQARTVESARGLTAQMGEATRRGAESVEATAGAARSARDVAGDGATAVLEATSAMEAIRASSDDVTSAVRELGEKSGRIGGIVDTITGIAGQTNLLALNAAIEAARAGEQGRGFAVVAEQVRQLAEESQAAAASIAALVEEIQAGTAHAVGVVEQGARRSSESAATVDRARDAFERIGGSVSDMHGRVDEIAALMRQIAADSAQVEVDVADVAAVAEQSSAATEQVSASAQQTSASAQELAASAQELAHTAEHLEQLCSRFVLAGA